VHVHVHAQARVEYWVSQYLRTPGELFYSSGAFPLSPRTPLLLALHRSWHAMHPRWNVFALDRALLSPAEARDFERWRPAGGRLPAVRAAPLPRWLLTADPLGHILHFSSVRKPWDLAAPANASTGAMCASPTPHAEARSFASDGATPALQPCALTWSEAARWSASQLARPSKDGRKKKPGLGGSTGRGGGSSSAAEDRSRAKDGRDGTKGGTSGGREAQSALSAERAERAERVSVPSKAKGPESKDNAAKEPTPALHDSCGSAGCGSAGGKGKGKRQGKAKDSAKAAKDSTKLGASGKASGKASPKASGKASPKASGKASPKVKGAIGKSKDKASSAKDVDGEDGEDDEDGQHGEDGEDGDGDPNPLFSDESEVRAGKKSTHNRKDDDDTDGRKRRKGVAPPAAKSSKTGAKRKSSSKNVWADNDK
jgi:hypothetical protein